MSESYTWVAYGDGTPTVAANNVANRLNAAAKAEKRFFANFGQGREQISVNADLQNEMIDREASGKKAMGFFDPAYNVLANAGGTVEQRAIAQAWLSRFIGQDDETFILPQTGRIALNEAFKMFAGYALVDPYEQWPMIKSIARRAGMDRTLEQYNLARGSLAKAIGTATDAAMPGHEELWYIGVPSNPRGLFPSPEELNELLALLEDIRGNGKPPVLLFDIPYFHAAKQRFEDGKPYLDTGLSTAFFDRLKELGVPYIASYSFSKALGSAKPGFSFMAVSPDLVAPMRTQLVEGSIGISYHPATYDAILNTLFLPEHDHSRTLPHFKVLADNYETNCDTLKQQFDRIDPALKRVFGDAATYGLLDGDAMMTRLFALPARDIFNRVVEVPAEFGLPDNSFTIRNTNDFLTCVANLAGVVLVDNGFARSGETMLIRVATAEPEQRFREGAQRLTNTLVKIARSPVAP